MASKSQYLSEEKGAEISDLLDVAEKLIDRTKILYEQYFMGIQKVAPSQLHRDLERRIRELSQSRIRNTALRYRLTTLSQKFGVYNTYWRRTLREIELGRYVRDVARVKRKAERTGEDIPDEILAAMPKRMRDRVRRDRDALAKRAAADGAGGDGEPSQSARGDDEPALIRSPRPRAHAIDDADAPDLGAMGEGGAMDDVYAALMANAESALDALEMRSPGGDGARRSAATSGASSDAAPARPPASAARPRMATPPPIPTARPRTPAPPPIPPARVAAGSSPARSDGPPVQRPADARAANPRVAARPGPPGRPARQRPAGAAGVAPPPGMSEAQARDLYARYVKARKMVGEPADGVSYGRLLQTLNQQAPKIMEQYKASGVEFNVVVRDNKVVLKAKPK